MSSIAMPQSVPVRRYTTWVVALVIALLAVGVTWFTITGDGVVGGGGAPSAYYTINPISMEVTVTKDGELQAINNTEIVCPVEGQSVIQSIVKEGTTVKKGDVIAVIETTDLTQKMETALLDLQKAEADLTAAKEAKEIQESTNVANLEAANVELVLARLDLEEYVNGTYPKLLASSKRDVEMARISVKTKEQDLAQQQALFAKGFVNASDVKTGEINLIKEQNTLASVEADLRVLEKYTYEKESTDRKNKVAQAEKKLVRVQRENMSQLAQKQADFNAKEQSLALRRRQMENYKAQLEAATIKAPSDGLVVYGSSGGWGRRETPIQAGANVRFQETLIRLPDTTRMKAVARIQEAQVSKLRVDPQRPMRAVLKIAGLPNPMGGWVSNISVMADSGSRWFNPDSKEYPVDVTLDTTPPGLKPGTTTEVKVYVERINEALAVPLPALYSAGPDSYVFERDGKGGHKPVKVKIGSVNDTHAQILDGIKQSDQVLLLQAGQGRELLEKAGIKVAAATRPSVLDDVPVMPMDRGPSSGGPGAGRGNGAGSSANGETPTTNPTGGRRRGTRPPAGEGTGGGNTGSGVGSGAPRPAATPAS
jgi:multidrug efflux pump subunit AcrA (membrane-fusion protein)